MTASILDRSVCSPNTVIDNGYNLDTAHSCVSAVSPATGSLHDTASGLDPNGLADHGGPTQTIALLASSNAIGKIPASTGLCTPDQRGATRPNPCDIGAYQGVPWRLVGFYRPVDMNGVRNTVKGGSTVPLKFEVFAETELTTTQAIGATLTVRNIPCATGAPEDPIDVLATNATELRYDLTAGQFIQSWKTPTGAGLCAAVTITTADGSSLTALKGGPLMAGVRRWSGIRPRIARCHVRSVGQTSSTTRPGDSPQCSRR